MKKASGILVNKDHDYAYIDTFIDFLERIIGIIMKLFDKLGSIGGSKDATTASDAAIPTNG